MDLMETADQASSGDQAGSDERASNGHRANPMRPWSTTDINLPDHAGNPVHTDAGARAAGFDRALVAGTTVYAYMTHPVIEAAGLAWLGGGGGELRLRKPVFDNDTVDCTINRTGEDQNGDDDPTVTAEVDGEARATLDVWPETEAPPMRDGERLKTLEVVLDQSHLDYGTRAGDDLGIYAERRIAHPVTWVNLANAVFTDELVTGPWVHVRSRIHHQGVAAIGATVRVESSLIERFDSRAGERALVDICMFADDEPVVTIEHEAIIVLR